MAHSRPPFHADHVGSLLRSKPLQEARAKMGDNEIELSFRPEMSGRVQVEIAADDKKPGRFTLNIKR